jgi:hypothetical protein
VLHGVEILLLVSLCKYGLKGLYPTSTLKQGTPSRVVSPIDSRITVVTASQQTLQALATELILVHQLKMKAMEHSQLCRDTASLEDLTIANS